MSPLGHEEPFRARTLSARFGSKSVTHLQIREMGVRGTEKPAGNPDRYRRQSMILVPLPHPAVVVQRMLPASAMTRRARPCRGGLRQRPCAGGKRFTRRGRGFETAQGRLGSGRIHHCMRLIGLAERALERMCRRTASRTAFGAVDLRDKGRAEMGLLSSSCTGQHGLNLPKLPGAVPLAAGVGTKGLHWSKGVQARRAEIACRRLRCNTG